jgi:hypothetical protein
LKFDYTYIVLGDFLIFEPMIIVSNFIFLVISIWGFLKLRTFGNRYSNAMSWFFLMIGISSIFGALCHSIHYQLDPIGTTVFDNMLFGMHAFSLLSTFFCFRGTLLHASVKKPYPRWVMPLAVAWITAVIIYSYLAGVFVLVTINAGVVLVFALVVYIRAAKMRNERGSLFFVWGIVAAFLSIAVHSLHISFHAWFNYKDFAHLFMIAAMILMAKGAIENSPLHFRATEQLRS